MRDKLDKTVYEEEIKDFIPEKIFDFHIHIWEKEQVIKKEEATSPSSHIREFTFEDLEKTHGKLLPKVKLSALVFGIPRSPKEIYTERMNLYISKKIKTDRKYYGLLLPSLKSDSNKLYKEIKKGNFKGFKPYLTMTEGKERENIRITDFVTKAQLEVANDLGLVILLHIPRKNRIADPLNIEDIIYICSAYPKVKIVLAHVGRSYGPYFLEKTIDKIKNLKNLYYDLAMVNDGKVIELLLENVSPSKIIYGSDIPIALEKGKHICINRQCVFITSKKFAWSVSSKNVECTYFLYEIIRAIKWAVTRKRLSQKDIEDIFYNNALRLLK